MDTHFLVIRVYKVPSSDDQIVIWAYTTMHLCLVIMTD